MANIDEYQIRDLAFGARRWRIDWFGAVTYAERYRRKSQPLIEIQLSELSEDLVDFNDLFALKNDQWPKTRQAKLPVGFLPLLKVGDIWKDGRLFESPQYDVEDFDDLRIDRDTTSIIKAGLSENDDGSFYLPISHHPYHIRHTHSYCVLVKTDAFNIVIPSVELIRFYFGSSSSLVSRIFEAPFSSENLWVGTEPHDVAGKPKIHLASGISGRSASDIGRIAFSKRARAAVDLIGNSCIAATANNQRAYPKAIFPFEGDTNLVASGKWLPFDGNERGVFLVFKLISCAYPFPFSGLRYTSERKGAPSTSTQFASEAQVAAGNCEKRFSKVTAETKSVVDAEPDKAKKPKRLSLFSGAGVQFPDLTGKPVAKVDVDQVPIVLHSLKGSSIVSGSSVGDGGNDAHVHPIELIGTNGGRVPLTGKSAETNALSTSVFLNLTSNLVELGRFVSVDIVRIDPRQRFEYLSTMPLIVDEDGEILSSCLVTVPSQTKEIQSETRHRRISIGRALELHASHFFMVPEQPFAEEDSSQEIELHVITDRSMSIRSNNDLQMAIAEHFVARSEIGVPSGLGTGIESVYFSETHVANHKVSAPIISEALCLHFFTQLERWDRDAPA